MKENPTKNEIQNTQCPSRESFVRAFRILPGYPNTVAVPLHPVHRANVPSRLNSAAGLAVVDLVAPLAALVGPREVGDGDDEEGVAWVGDTGKGVVPD